MSLCPFFPHRLDFLKIFWPLVSSRIKCFLSKGMYPSMSFLLFNYYFLIFLMLIYSWEIETEQGRGKERRRHRIWSRLWAPSCQHRAWRGTRTQKPWGRDLSRSRTPNPLSHPGAPACSFFRLEIALPGSSSPAGSGLLSKLLYTQYTISSINIVTPLGECFRN